ncbi:MAG: rhomboid family intramembrane serine protease [Flavobacteriaceae bacterium]
MSVLNDIKARFKHGTIVEQLIYINIGVFIIALLFSSFSGLYESRNNFIFDWFSLSSSFDFFITRPWTIVTYGFLHAGFLHILFNCIVLFYFGRMFLEYFSPKQLLSFYVLGTLFGGIIYLLSYNYFPIFRGQTAPLVGASAGISAIVIGIATYIPNYQLSFRFIGFIKLWHLAAVFILLDFIQLAGSNGGGHFAHIGGALFGFLYVSQASNKKIDLFGWVSNLFKTKKKPLKTVHKSKKRKTKKTVSATAKTEDQKQIDAILDKISKSGYDTLTKEEKQFLFKQGK